MSSKPGGVQMSDSSEHFYPSIPAFVDFAELTRLSWYRPLPDDWWVLVADIRGSTRAIEAGRYRDVNSVSAATLMAVLNACKPLAIPYVFGGDGMTACVPDSCRRQAANALLAARQMALEGFQLDLRIGLISMRELRQSQRDVLVARFQPSEHFQQAMFYGGGLAWAERVLKSEPMASRYAITEPEYQPLGSFAGFECRWQTIRSHQQETIALLVQPLGDDPQVAARVYRRVLAAIDRYCGDVDSYHPLRPHLLKLLWSPLALMGEGRVVNAAKGIGRWLHVLVVWVRLLFGRYLMALDPRGEDSGWRFYRQRVRANSDFRKCDEVLRMVFCCQTSQRQALELWLQKELEREQLVFGLHVSDGALVTCLVGDHVYQHVHFLDADGGGYALAARTLKQRLVDRVGRVL